MLVVNVIELTVVLDSHLLPVVVDNVIIFIVALTIRDNACDLSRNVIFLVPALLVFTIIIEVMDTVLLLLLHLELHLALLALARVYFLGSGDGILNVERDFFVLPVLWLVVAVLV